MEDDIYMISSRDVVNSLCNSLMILIMSFLLIVCSSKKNTELDKKEIAFNYNTQTEISVKVNNDKADVEILKFPEKGEDTLKASYFADTVLFVPLETNEDCFIKRLDQVWMNDSIILVNDRLKLLLFNREGEFLKQIGRQGKGPGEYGLIFNFDVILDTIYVSSRGKKAWIKYTLDGIFCEEIPFEEPPVWFSNTQTGDLARYHYEHGKIYIHDKGWSKTDTIVVETGVTTGRYERGILELFMPYFQKTSSGLLFNDYLNDTIWNIAKGNKQAAFVLDMKKELLPRNKHIEFHTKNDFDKWVQLSKPYKKVHLIPFEINMLIFEKYWNTDNYSAIYLQDRKSKEIKKYNTSYIYDDLVSKQELSNIIFTSSSEFLVGNIFPIELRKDMNSKKNNIREKASSSWLKQLKSVDINDNPILVLIKIKKEM